MPIAESGMRECGIEDEGNELPVQIIPVSAKTQEALDQNVANLADALAEKTNAGSSEELAAATWTLQNRRDEFTYRAAIVAESLTDAATTLKDRKAPRYMKRKSSATPRDVVFMFPGQGVAVCSDGAEPVRALKRIPREP